MDIVSENVCFEGVQGVYSHASDVCACEMTFGLYLPPLAKSQKVPVLWYLSGLTCTHENAMTKAGAQGWAAEQGLALVFPDTSPRGEHVADDEAFDLGKGAGFYVNAIQDPWSPNFQMWDYVAKELPAMVIEAFPIIEDAHGITGHSMGGHGALTMALNLPEQFKSVSAFAPIANPCGSDWGRKQLSAYLGDDETTWQTHDSAALMREKGFHSHILVDQGASDQFLDLLKPEALAEAVAARRQPATLRMQAGYDHSYFFVASFMEDHVGFHASALYGD